MQATGNASELRVRDLMTAPVYTLTAMQSLPLAESMMGLHHVRHVPVVDGDGRVVGLVTHRDLLSAKISSLAPLSEDERSELQLRVPVARIMRADVWTIGPDASAISAARIMQEHRFGCLPVVERERLVGIISEADLLALVTDSLSLERPVRGVHKEQEMKTESANESSRELVLVVAVDLSDVSEHLMSNARTILRSASEAELHVVHVVSREPFSQRITHPTHSMGASERAGSEAAQWELNRLCAAIADGCNAKVFTYTPIGEPAEEVIRVTREVGADLVLVETHHDKRLFHVSVATQIVQGAACSVLTLRRRPSQATAKPATPPEVRA